MNLCEELRVTSYSKITGNNEKDNGYDVDGGFAVFICTG